MNVIVTGKVEKQSGALIWKTIEKLDTASIGTGIEYYNANLFNSYVNNYNVYLRIADTVNDIIIIRFMNIPIFENDTKYIQSPFRPVQGASVSVHYGLVSSFYSGTTSMYITLDNSIGKTFSSILPVCEIGTFD